MSGVSVENATTSYSASSLGRITHGAMVVITERLAELPDLALPSSLYKDTARPPSTTEVLAYLQALLQKDPAAFLARYGSVLQSQELNHFEALRSGDYEVDHWLKHFAAQRMDAAAQAANPRRLPAKVKNRRLAAMRRLAAQGEYFSDEAMRERAPLLYHQQIGRFVEDEEQQQQQQQQQEDGLGPSQPGQVELQGLVGGSNRMPTQTEVEGAPLRQCARVQGAPASGGLGGGLGGSCLVGALRAALESREGGPLVDSSGAAGTSGRAPATATAAATTAGPAAATGHSCSAADASEHDGSGAGGAGGHRLPAPQQQDGGGAGSPGAGTSRGSGVSSSAGPGPIAAGGVIGGAPARSAAAAAAAEGSRLPPRAGGVPPAGLLFSEFLMRQDDEAQLYMRRMQEQREEDAQMSEHESDDESEEQAGDDDDDGEEEDGDADEVGGEGGDDMAVEGGRGTGGAGRRRRGRTSASEQALLRRDFVSEMQSRFLLGQDTQYVDYGAIDADASLDGDWLEEESRDAEEKYFDED